MNASETQREIGPKKKGIKAKLVDETKMLFVVFLYLFAFLGTFTLYRRMVLDVYQISYLHYGCNIIEALLLAKVILLGNAFGVGERFHNRPLIVPTVYKTICFSLLVLLFSILEQMVVGLISGSTVGAVWNAILDQGMWEILARAMVIFLSFLPLFAVWETGRILGKGRLYELFFKSAPSH
jgi:hypothetical protein